MSANEQLCADLLALGVRPGGVLLVHSSLRALGFIPGGAEAVIQGLLEALGPQGTLLMPALSYEHVTPAEPALRPAAALLPTLAPFPKPFVSALAHSAACIPPTRCAPKARWLQRCSNRTRPTAPPAGRARPSTPCRSTPGKS